MNLNPEQLERIANGNLTGISTNTAQAQEVPPSTPSTEPLPTSDPIIEQPKVEPQSMDIFEQLRQSTGLQLNSLDDIRSLSTKASESDELKKQLAESIKERDQFRLKSELDPFANEFEKARNELLKRGATKEQVRAFEKANDIDLKNIDPFDAMKIRLQIENGLSEDKANKYLNNKYNLDPEKFTQDEIELGRINLEKDSTDALKFIESHKVQVSTAPVNPEESNRARETQEREAFNKSVEPIVKSMISTFEAYKKFSLNGKEGEQEIELPGVPDFQEKVENHTLDYVKALRINPNTESGRQEIKNYLDNAFRQLAFEPAIRHVAAQRERELRIQNENPSVVTRGAEGETQLQNEKFADFKQRLANGDIYKNRK